MRTFFFSILFVASSFIFNANTVFAENFPRTVMVQFFQWPWRDVAKECETYLAPNGFVAAQVSPVTEHLMWDGDPWWVRYQPISYKIDSQAGSEQEFRDMVRRCKQAGVDIYVDVILNHMAGIDEGRGNAGTVFTHYEYPGLYSYDDFHHCGRNGNDRIVDFTNLYELWNCELVHLADLKTESPVVRGKQAEFLNRLLDMGVAGFRIDAAKHMPSDDINAVLRMLKRPAFVYQELILSPGEPINPNDYLKNGHLMVFGYAFDVGRAFRFNQLGRLQNVGKGPGYPSTDSVVVFVDDHDLQRKADAYTELLTYQRDPQLYRLANIFMLAWPYGYPRLFSGYRFNNVDQGAPVDQSRHLLPVISSSGQCVEPWLCEHRLQGMASMVQFRNVTDRAFYYTDWWSNERDQIAFGRGARGFVVINSSSSTLKRTFVTSMNVGRYCNILSSSYNPRTTSCQSGYVVVDSQGNATFEVPPRSAAAIHIGAYSPL